MKYSDAPPIRTIEDVEQSQRDLEFCFAIELRKIDRKKNALIGRYLDAKIKLEAEKEQIAKQEVIE